MVETLNNTSITHPLGYRMSDTNVYYEEMDRKWRDLIIFFNKCQVFVGIGPQNIILYGKNRTKNHFQSPSKRGGNFVKQFDHMIQEISLNIIVLVMGTCLIGSKRCKTSKSKTRRLRPLCPSFTPLLRASLRASQFSMINEFLDLKKQSAIMMMIKVQCQLV